MAKAEARALDLGDEARTLGEQETALTLDTGLLNTAQRQFDKLRGYLARSALAALKG